MFPPGPLLPTLPTMTETVSDPVIDWLLASDPSVRWQVMRDLLDTPDDAWLSERARVATEGWGAELLSHEDADGQWAGGAFFPADLTDEEWHDAGQPWTATAWAFTQLRELGLEPDSVPARRATLLAGENSRWEADGAPFWQGEVEECINGRTVADGCYFGVDMAPLVDRLVGEAQPDGAWNCERINGSTRSSFDTTINVLEGLLEFERATGGTPASRSARRRGEEFLLERHLMRRLSTGEIADPDFLRFSHPVRWHYDVLRALDHFRAASLPDSAPPDPRLAEAIDIVRSRRRSDGRWDLDISWPGRRWLRLDEGVGSPSVWVTLRAMRVLRWWDAG